MMFKVSYSSSLVLISTYVHLKKYVINIYKSEGFSVDEKFKASSKTDTRIGMMK